MHKIMSKFLGFLVGLFEYIYIDLFYNEIEF